jgi:hypothetical protein
MAVLPSTVAWCVTRDHPWVTYNPWLDRSWCRCGQRQADGQQPPDWDAIAAEHPPHAKGCDATKACTCRTGPGSN